MQHLPESVSRQSITFDQCRVYWNEKNRKNNDADLVRLLFLIQTVEEMLDKNVPGSIAELGVYKGNSAKLLHELAPDRRIYLFDTFEGFDSKDVKIELKNEVKMTEFKDTSLDQVKRFLGNSRKVVFCPGFFPESSSYVPENETFALVHLDADLYGPTLAGLEYFYERMPKGGTMIVHDYSSGAWPGIKRAVDEFLTDKPETLVRIPDKSGTVIFKKAQDGKFLT
ncbi:MAG TPA: TylF/MycF/NovP-related O-methyltransferase [Oligoflexus sp.]|uniref:TylF/MycF/NovP-related O-methyltransferase n=1 Tax=Oligoflexus sp. TaxID=1971216 RepID=UPI002D800857|nr:TylF/MycF/NovP-related O-methyltransferase [Oligoflexus sp.]HET9236344.1 TylF/MycF/NovP-related O-methyltransferase [Oligoflexus sp.]